RYGNAQMLIAAAPQVLHRGHQAGSHHPQGARHGDHPGLGGGSGSMASAPAAARASMASYSASEIGWNVTTSPASNRAGIGRRMSHNGTGVRARMCQPPGHSSG